MTARPNMVYPHRLSQFPPIDPATIGRALRDGRAYRAAEQIYCNAPDLHAHRHYRIGGCPRWLDVSAKAFIIAAGIVSVALWVAF
jgi:hypothetical protein